MKMLMIIFKESLEEEVQGVLTRHHVKAFTEMHDVTGVGEGGATLHSHSWPGYNIMILAALPEPEADKVVGALKDYREGLVKKQGNAKIPLRVFTLPCELVV